MRETDGGSLYYIVYGLGRYPTEHPKKLLDILPNIEQKIRNKTDENQTFVFTFFRNQKLLQLVTYRQLQLQLNQHCLTTEQAKYLSWKQNIELKTKKDNKMQENKKSEKNPRKLRPWLEKMIER